MPRRAAALALLGFAAAAATAQTPEGQQAVDRISESACLRAARLDDARISAPVHYSGNLQIEVRIVDGVPPDQAGGPRTLLLCLYNRGTARAETQAFDPNPTLAYSREVREVWWHAREIEGRPVIGSDVLTMSLGEGGRVTGRSGCNLYSALYQLDEESLEVVWPMTGTRENCPQAAVMDQEVRFRDILLKAVTVRLDPADGSLLLTDREDRTIRFVRAESQMPEVDPATP